MIRVTCVCAFSCRHIEVGEGTPLDRVINKIAEPHCSACSVMIRGRTVDSGIASEPVGRFSVDGDLRVTRLCDPEPFIGSDGMADESFQTYPCVNNRVMA